MSCSASSVRAPSRSAAEARSAKEGVEESVGALAEGGAQEAGAVPAALDEDALGVAEGSEAFDSVVFAHSAGADAAEREIVLPDMHDRAVDGDVAGGCAVEHFAPVGVVGAEVVEGERSRS